MKKHLVFTTSLAAAVFVAGCSGAAPVRPVGEIAPKAETADTTERPAEKNTGDSRVSETPPEKELVEPQEQEQIPAEGEATSSGFSLTEKLESAQTQLNEVEAELKEKESQLQLISEINQEFCYTFLEQKNTCPGLISLIPEWEADETSCVQNGLKSGDLGKIVVTVNTNISSSEQRFYLVANGGFFSSEFGTGLFVPLEWSQGTQTNVPPHLYQVADLELVSVSGALPNYETVDFSLGTDRGEILSKEHLIAWEPGATRARINTIPLTELLRMEACQVTQDDLSEISNTIRGRAAPNDFASFSGGQ